MFNFFKKKKSIPNDLVFKSNQAAFEYSCMFLDTSLENENPVLGIVLEVKNNDNCAVKISNDKDPTIPTESISELLARTPIDKTICFRALITDHICDLKKGDLVMYITLPDLASLGQGTLSGILIAKVEPIYNLEEGGWINSN